MGGSNRAVSDRLVDVESDYVPRLLHGLNRRRAAVSEMIDNIVGPDVIGLIMLSPLEVFSV
jgi:hypothetical protein